MAEQIGASFWERNEFLIRRLHSLSGLIPVGAYMVVHLMTNASVLDSPATYQRAVFGIQSLGSLLPVVEWTFIFIPILFHAILGVVIIAGGVPNTQSYPYAGNFRYTMQRATGMIAFAFIMWHVFHMHGWFHFDWWLENVARPLAGAQFAPYNAASTLGATMQGTGAIIVIVLYAIGVLASVYHLANGIWTMGMTWGVWVTPDASRRAGYVCNAFGVALAVVGLSAIYGAATVDVEEARNLEDRMYHHRVEAGDVLPNPHKRAHASLTGGAATHDSADPEEDADGDSAPEAADENGNGNAPHDGPPNESEPPPSSDDAGESSSPAESSSPTESPEESSAEVPPREAVPSPPIPKSEQGE